MENTSQAQASRKRTCLLYSISWHCSPSTKERETLGKYYRNMSSLSAHANELAHDHSTNCFIRKFILVFHLYLFSPKRSLTSTQHQARSIASAADAKFQSDTNKTLVSLGGDHIKGCEGHQAPQHWRAWISLREGDDGMPTMQGQRCPAPATSFSQGPLRAAGKGTAPRGSVLMVWTIIKQTETGIGGREKRQKLEAAGP